MRETFTSGSVGRAPGNRCLYPEGAGGITRAAPPASTTVGPPASQRGAPARGDQPRHEERLSTVRGVWVWRSGMNCSTQYP